MIARRRAAAIALAHADFEWEVDLEDLNRLFLLRQAGLVGQVWKVRRHTKEVIGYIHRQRDVAMPSMRDIGGRSGLMEGDPNSPGQAAMWVRSTYDLAATFRRSKGSFQAFIETVWKVSQQEVLRSCIMVAVAMALRRRWKFRREMPGLWGTTPNEHESRARFEGRFLAALERQAEEGIKEAAEIDRRNREAKRRIASSAREGSSALEAWSMLLARRVISPALLASDVGLSVRGASLVLERLVGLGLAVEVVERRAYRRFVAADDHEALSILANHSRRPGGSKSPGHALPGANSDSDGVLLANGDDAPRDVSMAAGQADRRSSCWTRRP